MEQKCRFFIWLMLQIRLPKSDCIIKQGGQGDPICKLCHTTAESTLHLFANCAYAAGVWHRTSAWSQLQLPTTNMHTSVRRWWRLILQAGATDMESSLQIIIYMVWNLWKEMCRRVFQSDRGVGCHGQDRCRNF